MRIYQLAKLLLRDEQQIALLALVHKTRCRMSQEQASNLSQIIL